jgi:hypothetical protein
MKGKREHRVPLNDPALEVLEQMKDIATAIMCFRVPEAASR